MRYFSRIINDARPAADREAPVLQHGAAPDLRVATAAATGEGGMADPAQRSASVEATGVVLLGSPVVTPVSSDVTEKQKVFPPAAVEAPPDGDRAVPEGMSRLPDRPVHRVAAAAGNAPAQAAGAATALPADPAPRGTPQPEGSAPAWPPQAPRQPAGEQPLYHREPSCAEGLALHPAQDPPPAAVRDPWRPGNREPAVDDLAPLQEAGTADSGEPMAQPQPAQPRASGWATMPEPPSVAEGGDAARQAPSAPETSDSRDAEAAAPRGDQASFEGERRSAQRVSFVPEAPVARDADAPAPAHSHRADAVQAPSVHIGRIDVIVVAPEAPRPAPAPAAPDGLASRLYLRRL